MDDPTLLTLGQIVTLALWCIALFWMPLAALIFLLVH